MKNISIVVTDNHTIVVKADTKRYGKNTIMFEGYTFMQCCDYIRRTCKTNNFRLKSYSCVKMYTDSDGRTMPWIIDVEIRKEG